MKYLDAFLRDRQPTVQNENVYFEEPSKPSKPLISPSREGFEGFEGTQNYISSKKAVGCSHPQNPQNPSDDQPDISLLVFLDLLDCSDEPFPAFESLPGVADLEESKTANLPYRKSRSAGGADHKELVRHRNRGAPAGASHTAPTLTPKLQGELL